MSLGQVSVLVSADPLDDDDGDDNLHTQNMLGGS